MKPNLETTQTNSAEPASVATEPAERVIKPAPPEGEADPKHFRRLKWNEVVRRGDFVADENQGFEPWDGPGGFQADSFLKPIYRRAGSRSTPAQKLK